MIPKAITAPIRWWGKHPWMTFCGITLFGGPLVIKVVFRLRDFCLPDDLSLLGTKICVWALIALWLGSFIYAESVTWKRSKIDAVIAVMTFVIVVALMIPQFATMRRRGPDPEISSNLKSLHVACTVYWRNTHSQNSCTVETASEYGYRQSPKLTITASGNEASFTATACGRRRGTWAMDACGKIKLLDQ